MSTNATCQKCDGKLADGFLLDATRAGNIQALWVEGEVREGKLLGMSTGVDVSGTKIGVTALRCTKCGYLELYAKES